MSYPTEVSATQPTQRGLADKQLSSLLKPTHIAGSKYHEASINFSNSHMVEPGLSHVILEDALPLEKAANYIPMKVQ